MRVESTAVYGGPNRWAYFPVIQLRVDLGRLEDWPSGRLGAGFQQALLQALPGLHEHRCSWGVPGGFVRRLTEDEGTWLGHVLEHTTLELQNMAGSAVSFGRARSVAGRHGVYDVVYEYRDRELGLAAGRLAFDLLQSLLPAWLRTGAAEDARPWADALTAFLELARERALGPSTAALVRAAELRRIPWERLDGDHLIQLGWGARQTRVQSAITSRTSQIAVEVAQDKHLTNRLLHSLGIPVPAQVRVWTEEEAVTAAERLGYPVVVKPTDGNHGRGVSTGLGSAAEVRIGWREAMDEGRGVMVEEHVPGSDHRLLVVGGRMIAAARRIPAHVVGDGTSTVEQLVAMVNADPRRGAGHGNVLTRIELDEEADRMLRQRGLDRVSVPAAGDTVQLRRVANLSRGGTAMDVTEIVHQDNRQLAERAAAAVGLDVAGVDFLTPDITRSYLDVGGGVCEINAGPGLRMHIAPSEGSGRDVAGPILDLLYPPGTSACIPTAAITGTNGKTTTARMVAHIAAAAGHRVGLTTTNGVYVGGRMVARGDMTGPASARMLLRDASVDCAVLETARGGILREGLAFRRCTVGAVLNVTADHLGLGGIDTVEQMAEVKRIVVEVATDLAVLNADDPASLAMREHAGAARVCLVTLDPESTAVAQHVAAGGLAVVVEDDADSTIVLRDGSRTTTLIAASAIPATVGGVVRFNVENAAFAAAIALGLGIGLETVRAALATFTASIEQTPGRLNIFDGHPFRVVLDYGHNPAAVRSMCDVARRLGNGGRCICVIAAPGDRRDDDIRAVAAAAAGWADLYICRRDDGLRGRSSHEVPRLLREGLIAAGVDPHRIREVPEEADATVAGLRAATPGDLLLLFSDDVARTWQQILDFRPESASPDDGTWPPRLLPVRSIRAALPRRRAAT